MTSSEAPETPCSLGPCEPKPDLVSLRDTPRRRDTRARDSSLGSRDAEKLLERKANAVPVPLPWGGNSQSPTRPDKALSIRGHRSGRETTVRVLLRTPGAQHMPGGDELTSTFPPPHIQSTQKASGESQCGHRKCRVAPRGKVVNSTSL